jgi:hypothetical protein
VWSEAEKVQSKLVIVKCCNKLYKGPVSWIMKSKSPFYKSHEHLMRDNIDTFFFSLGYRPYSYCTCDHPHLTAQEVLDALFYDGVDYDFCFVEDWQCKGKGLLCGSMIHAHAHVSYRGILHVTLVSTFAMLLHDLVLGPFFLYAVNEYSRW